MFLFTCVGFHNNPHNNPIILKGFNQTIRYNFFFNLKVYTNALLVGNGAFDGDKEKET